MKPRRWRDVRVCGRTVWLQHCPREIRCPTHGRRVEDRPVEQHGAFDLFRFTEYRMTEVGRTLGCERTTWQHDANASAVFAL